MAGPVHERLANDGRSAAVAGLTFSSVDVEGTPEISRAAIDVDVELVERGTTLLQGLDHHPASNLPQLDGLPLTHGVGGGQWMQPSTPQGLIGIDVADPRDETLVEHGAFHGTASPTHPLGGLLEVDPWVEEVSSDVCDLGGQRSTTGAHPHGPEDALVDEPEDLCPTETGSPTQVGSRFQEEGGASVPVSVVSRLPPRTNRLVPTASRQKPGAGGVGPGVDAELPAHPQVCHQCGVVIQSEPQVLAAAAHIDDGAIPASVDECSSTPDLASHQAGMVDLHTTDSTIQDVFSQAASDRLDLRKFRHSSTR